MRRTSRIFSIVLSILIGGGSALYCSSGQMLHAQDGQTILEQLKKAFPNDPRIQSLTVSPNFSSAVPHSSPVVLGTTTLEDPLDDVYELPINVVDVTSMTVTATEDTLITHWHYVESGSTESMNTVMDLDMDQNRTTGIVSDIDVLRAYDSGLRVEIGIVSNLNLQEVGVIDWVNNTLIGTGVVTGGGGEYEVRILTSLLQNDLNFDFISSVEGLRTLPFEFMAFSFDFVPNTGFGTLVGAPTPEDEIKKFLTDTLNLTKQNGVTRIAIQPQQVDSETDRVFCDMLRRFTDGLKANIAFADSIFEPPATQVVIGGTNFTLKIKIGRNGNNGAAQQGPAAGNGDNGTAVEIIDSGVADEILFIVGGDGGNGGDGVNTQRGGNGGLGGFAKGAAGDQGLIITIGGNGGLGGRSSGDAQGAAGGHGGRADSILNQLGRDGQAVACAGDGGDGSDGSGNGYQGGIAGTGGDATAGGETQSDLRSMGGAGGHGGNGSNKVGGNGKAGLGYAGSPGGSATNYTPAAGVSVSRATAGYGGAGGDGGDGTSTDPGGPGGNGGKGGNATAELGLQEAIAFPGNGGDGGDSGDGHPSGHPGKGGKGGDGTKRVQVDGKFKFEKTKGADGSDGQKGQDLKGK